MNLTLLGAEQQHPDVTLLANRKRHRQQTTDLTQLKGGRQRLFAQCLAEPRTGTREALLFAPKDALCQYRPGNYRTVFTSPDQTVAFFTLKYLHLAPINNLIHN
ncbi:hypothetical protein QLQ86_18675 [Halomonas sp. LR5S13]|uniref:hypothetical protein n=1 Tax=Halomonas rhizosphaerae TaxID=3043296 RepID=UPI0024A82C6A|nr:hypothetical protein [Halomonas rhizosphaerae]MDI5922793.1 hypothetical protein [Halomonas rhizosphaerae]